jgi:thioredoxin-dependent peroxiredoxin
MIQVGQKIDTSIVLQIVENEIERTTTLAEILTKPFVISVYMKNNTSSCDNQNKSLVEFAQEIEKKGVGLLAISKDTCGSHKKYIAKQGISYLLASDPDENFPRITDSIVEKSMYGKKYFGASRSAFVIGTDGTVLGIIEKVDSKNHGQQVLDLLETII